MIKVEEMLKFLNIHDINKGINYYGNIDIIDQEVNLNTLEKTTTFEVQSESYHNNFYEVIVHTKDDKITSVVCDCPRYEQTDSCKHISAACINYWDSIFVDEDDKMSDPNYLENKRLQTGLNILSLFEVNEEKRHKKKELLNVEIEITEIDSYYRKYYSLKIRIGTKKLYVLNKKFNDFLDAYNGKIENVYFGKEFTYNSNNYYLDENSINFIEYIERNYEPRDLEYLTDDKLYRIINNIKGIDFSFDDQGIIHEVIKGNPFIYELTKKDNLYTLKIKNMDSIKLIGDNNLIALYQHKAYKLDNNTSKIINAISNIDNNELIFLEENISKFTNGLLNHIKNNVELEEQLQDKIVICKTPDVLLYIDNFGNSVICKIIFKYNDKEINYFDKTENIVRDYEYESDVISDLFTYNFQIDNNKLLLTDIDDIGNFLLHDIDTLASKYEVYTSDKIKKSKLIKSSIRGAFSIGQDNILSYKFNFGELSDKEVTDILKNLNNNHKYYRLKSGEILNLSEDDSLKQLNELVSELDINGEFNGVIPKYQAIYLDLLKKDKYSIIDTNNQFDNFINKFNTYKDLGVDLSKNDLSILRDYQVTGVKWLYNIYKCELGGILADEMGLGKSIQFIYFIKQVLKELPDSKILIISPTSLIFNWEHEFLKFGKELKYKVLYGLKEKRSKVLNDLSDTNIIITSYGLLREDLDEYLKIKFEVTAIDEAQNIKNVFTQVTKAVKQINSTTKIALTGTPLENNITELWSIFDYIMPGYLTNLKSFQSKYNIKDIDNDNLKKLDSFKMQIKPFILRRKKSDVLKELPPKIENNIYIDLSDEEKKIYMATVEKTRKEMNEIIATEGFDKARFKILQLLTRLRQICIDPHIVYENYDGSSSKINELVKLVKEIIENGHKILIFTSFKTVLDIVNNTFIKEGISTYCISGEVNSKKRMELVDKFNTDDTNVFLITLKSGGTGLNLTSADVVIHLDLWWNPQVENQATDRSHRIGQKNSVEVIKLICKGTIEEKILDLQNKKKTLTDNLIEGNDRDINIISKLSADDIKSLFVMDKLDEN